MSSKSTAANRRILSFLQSGRDISVKQARARFGIKNVTQRINDLRAAGYAIYENRKTTQNGETITVFRLGAPTRAVVAAGFLAIGDPAVADIVESNLALV